MRTRPAVDKLPGNAHAVRGLTDAALKNVAHAEFAADLLHGHRLALIGEAGVPGDYEQPPHARERGDDLLHDAIGEILLLRVTAHILEWKHRYRRFVRER